MSGVDLALVRVRAVADTGTAAATSVKDGITTRPGESLAEFGARVIADEVLTHAGCWPRRHAPISMAALEWIGPRVVDLSGYVRELPTRSNCGCQPYPSEIVTALLHTFGVHTCADDDACDLAPGRRCAGLAWVDCQRCARDWMPTQFPPGCDRCGSQRDGWYLVVGVGDLNVIVRACLGCA